MATNIIKVKVDNESREEFERWTQVMEELTSELRNFARAIIAAAAAFQELNATLDKAGDALAEEKAAR